MNRRDFLKLAGVTSLAAFAFPAKKLTEYALTSHEAERTGVVYRGTSSGEILISKDQRKTWQKHTSLGSQYSVAGISPDMVGNLYAMVEFGSRDFFLSLSADGNNWLVT